MLEEGARNQKDGALKKKKLRKSQWRWGILLASGLNYTGIMLLLIFWQLDLVPFLLLILGVSLLIGALLVDFEKAFLYSISGLFIGNALAAGIYMMPFNVFKANIRSVNVGTIVILSLLGKHLLLAVTPYLVGVGLGCFLGDHLTGHGEA